MVQASGASKNLWVAASDGDLERVKALIEQGQSPNAADPNSYTPMHAAASYGHIELLEYLVSVGGNVNITDEDGETPLFTCENVETAQWLIEHGADRAHKNEVGERAADVLEDEHPEVSAFLREGLEEEPEQDAAEGFVASGSGVSQLAMDDFTARQTAELLEQSRKIMEEAERDGVDPDDRLRELVEGAVRQGFTFGGQLGDAAGAAQDEAKRAREE